MPNNISCIILAAGNSRRFGSSKMNYRLASGLTILQTTVKSYAQFFNNISVVIQPDDEPLLRTLEGSSVNIIESPNADRGLSQSMIAAMQASPPENSYVFALGDMPFIQPGTIEQFKEAIVSSNSSNIITLSMNERLGNPVAFGSSYRESLLSLSGDFGAKSIVSSTNKSNSQALIRIEVQDQGIFWDIDSEADLPSEN